ncbi:hypothetical protein PC41400_16640 [Paenibacillus chitinolyticus]|uniref:Uncharacterized protein n=1 Tax=Paenibacillus chitinolyticus TaxID=79263 RepID=A0A410WYD5_9BACL|nr:hypothetical protein [Paenibacillus chitinolyticus]MCY9589847.1 hypothetical protein [Paenibacillus chitinolyticus]MCY9598152.1 hypothetical protein [Paenibacillus chitinolyticus]QAV19221.1 hypothetical protein PC41400_16640 [Paenibacillus chitinolyticus]
MKEIHMCCGIANVTNAGLQFNGLYYSNPTLIKLDWFLLAEMQGSWPIPILFDLLDNRHILLLDFDHFEVATTIEKDEQHLDPEIVDAYQQAFRNLKTLLFWQRRY